MKQRIMGLIILIAVALIFIPLLFSRSGSTPPSHSSLATKENEVLPAQSATNQAPPASSPVSYQPTPVSETQPPQKQEVFQNGNSAILDSTTQSDAATTQLQVGASSNTSNPENNSPPLSVGQEISSAGTSASAATNTNSTVDTLVPTKAIPNTATSDNQKDQQVMPTVIHIQPTVNSAGSPSKTITDSESGVLQVAQQQFSRTAQQQSTNEQSGVNSNVQQKTVRSNYNSNKNQQHLAAKTNNKTLQINKNSISETRHGWIIQLGSFAEQSHVTKLVQQLHTQGLVPHVMPVKTSHGTITRVYLGPERQRQKADQIAKQLQEKLSIHCIVMPVK